jgi:nucleotide-binding universal stress UspA family protein
VREDAAVSIVAVATLRAPLAEVPSVTAFRRSVLEQAHGLGQQCQEVLKPRWPLAEVMEAEGDPGEEIIRAADDLKADLVVMGARGGSGHTGGLGSVAASVARCADCAVLVTRGEPRHVATAVVAVDGSEGSLEALRFLSSLELDRDSSLRLLHVMKVRISASHQAERHAEAERLLEGAARALAGRDVRIERTVTTGNPAAEIVRAARSAGADLVVVGARRQGAVRRLLRGTVSGRVLRQAPCPVLVLKGCRPPR